MDPINYSTDVASPFAAAMQGYAGGAAIRDDQLKQQAIQQAQQAQQQQAQVLQNLISNPRAGAQDYANAALLVPGMREQLKQSWDTKNTDQQASHLSEVSQWFAATKSGSPEIAVDAMKKKADAMQASGADPREVQALRTQAQVVQEHPEFARTMMGMMLSSIPGGDKVITGAASLGSEARADALAPADLAIKTAEAKIKGVDAVAAPVKVTTDIANVQSQIDQRSKQYGLDRDKLTTDTQLALKKMEMEYGQLPEFVAKDINAATTDAIAAQQSADKMTNLASRLEAEGGGFGLASSASEWIKKATGNQNEMTRLRSEYNRIATPAAMAAYKKVATGSTSDKDIDTAMVGVPKDNADAETMAAFLRGAAKLQVYDAVLNNAKSEWLGAVRNLGKAKTDIEIDGVKVPSGATFKNFVDQYVPRKIGEQTTAATIKASPYAQFATPAAVATPSPVLGD